MPSVGMRRTTRVFGVVKGADSARVLRSGRRLWPDSGEGKMRRVNEGDEWVKKPEKNANAKTKHEIVVVDDDANEDYAGVMELEKQGPQKAHSSCKVNVPDRFFGIVYSRKRKRMSAASSELATDDNKMFGLQFTRRQWRKNRSVLSIVVKHSRRDSDLFSSFLFLVLRHVTRFRLTLKELSAFFLSEPICGAYASRGIQFLQGSLTSNIGICQFSGITRFMPLFCVDFSAVPLCFKCLHSEILLKSMLKSFLLVYNPLNVSSDVEEEIDFPEFQMDTQISCNSFTREASESGVNTPDVIEINDGLSLRASVKCSRLASRYGQYRNVNSKCIRRRRTSLRKRKARNPSMMDRSNGVLASDLKNGRKKSIVGVASNMKLRSLANSCTTVSLSEAKSTMVDSTEGLHSSHCSTNILITESDRCYRVEGAVITLEEMPASRGWLLVAKKDGLTRCTLKAEKVMRPHSSNRYTHGRIFSLDNGLKLEFASYQDWIVFKDLYKECSDRNVPAPVAKVIPVPGVRDVSGYADSYDVPFHRPDAYISANGNELSRAMTRKTANYDLDSEDEEWLSTFNKEFQEYVSEDNFELIVDALEKAYYCNPDDCYDEKSVSNWCQDLGSKEVVEAVYSYWMRKRKQKRSSLLRVFQSHQSKRAPLIPKPLLRKKRSFKRQPSHFGRGKHPNVLQAKQDALEEKNSVLKIEAAKASADESKEFAIQKRKRAQFLMENADLAIYKATMLVRMAEAAQAGESVDALAGHFLD
ncbi:uncharacterized protein LOC133316475 isoform X2 [Gastrolobium bilobum]|uniref:uncharacterized protein LOC133316475 isoform X2 n=1 Tax=Gastrolobium bilobum TaxID=150636 RepID=UPI002AB06C36|nr:uncharacterized protein LOC133316475 isoform X2 [Gastrolobium bilobum]